MKSHMLKFRRDWACASSWMRLLLLPLVSACAGHGFLNGEVGAHPAELVGEWLDSAKTRGADTSLWVLTSTGEDQVRRVRPSGERDAHHYGYWFMQGSLRSADHAICFTNRPGRSAPTCLPFDLDSASTVGAPRKRLVVRGYHGAHSTGDRVLLAYP